MKCVLRGGGPGGGPGAFGMLAIYNLGPQATTGTVDVAEDHVRLEVQLPRLLSLLANKAKALVEKQGTLLLEKPVKPTTTRS